MAEATLSSRSRYGRVPTASNVADPASRLDWVGVRSVIPRARWSEPVAPRSWQEKPKDARHWFRGA
eukprot:206896-Heterocapsa_arctica.AAC.1